MIGEGKLLVACCAFAMLSTALAPAAPAQPNATNTLNHLAGFDIRTEHFTYNLNNGDFTLPTHFNASRAGTDITADRAQGNSERKEMHAYGHVVVHQNEPLHNGGKAADLTQRPSTLTCDTLDVNGNTQVYTAIGNMHFTQEGGHEATSDRAVLDDATHHLHMEGHVRVRNGEQTIEADVLDYDTVTGQLVGNGNVTITAPVETPLPGTAATRAPQKKTKHGR
ncbi:MAG: LptA/OstA family protein [Candidatus Eremiobacteraeota bacterium]|nr:LptA/OstA family protein [Candidatus Eremiobacteraeota bacterium]